jgi:2-polyprenyl-6-methoxyphenol hydroxylase-like FAD-dependent oxidoreductase
MLDVGRVIAQTWGMSNADVLIIGGGPAGVMAGLLFARAGVSVTIFEKHRDFLRDFRGDTVHPATMEILDEIGLLDRFLERPHSRVDAATLTMAGQVWKVADFSHLDTPAPFIAMMPQWDFLDFLCDEARAYPGFDIRMEAEVTGLIEENGRVVGVQLADGETVRSGSGLVIAADGRRSVVRSDPALPLINIGAPMDILWFAIPKHEAVEEGLRGIIGTGQMMVLIDRDSYWQCAYLIAKGEAEQVKARGIAAFRRSVEALAPELAPLDTVLTDVDQLKLLTVALERLEVWHKPGLLVIGDAAHTMSPIGGIGINLAIQDAVAAANVLAQAIRDGVPTDPLLPEVQRRRIRATRLIQSGQNAVQNQVISPILADKTAPKVPFAIRVLNRIALLRRIPARIAGLGIDLERVESPDDPGAMRR